MNENPFMPKQSNKARAFLLVSTVLLSIGLFLITYIKWGNVLISLAIAAVVTVFVFVLLRNVLLQNFPSRYGQREPGSRRRRK